MVSGMQPTGLGSHLEHHKRLRDVYEHIMAHHSPAVAVMAGFAAGLAGSMRDNRWGGEAVSMHAVL